MADTAIPESVSSTSFESLDSLGWDQEVVPWGETDIADRAEVTLLNPESLNEMFAEAKLLWE